MSQDAKSSFADIPPDWIGLTDVLPTLRRCFGINFAEWVRDLTSEIRKGQMQHRVAGLSSDDLYARAWDTYTRIPGLTYNSEKRAVTVDDWEAAKVDWESGTVGGVRLQGGGRQRHRIELWWFDLERWAKARVEARRLGPGRRAVIDVTPATGHTTQAAPQSASEEPIAEVEEVAMPGSDLAERLKQLKERRLATGDGEPTPASTPGVIDGWDSIRLCAKSEPGCSDGRAVAIFLAALSSGEVDVSAYGHAFGKMDWTGFAVDRGTGRVGREPYTPPNTIPGTIRYVQPSQLPDDLNLGDMEINERDLRYWLNKQPRSNKQPPNPRPTPVEHEPQSADEEASIGQAPANATAGDPPPSEARATAPSPQTTAPSPLKSGRAGGRPPKWDWDGFAREMVRLANTPNGLPDRRATAEHMRKWCASEWGCEPADSVLRDKIARLYPDPA